MIRARLAILAGALAVSSLLAAGPPPQPEPCDEVRAVREIGQAAEQLAKVPEQVRSLPEDQRKARENELSAPANAIRAGHLSRCPESPAVLESLTRSEYRLGRAEGGLELAERAVALAEFKGAPKPLAAALAARAEGRRLSGDLSKAAADAARALELDRDNTRAFAVYQFTRGREKAEPAEEGSSPASGTGSSPAEPANEEFRKFIRIVPGGGIPPADHAALERIALAAIDRLQQSAEGRDIMSLTIQEARRLGVPITILPERIAGSELVVTDGVEEATQVQGYAFGPKMRYSFNHLFGRMRDADLATQTMAPNMGHELTHMVWHHQAQREFPQYLDILRYDLTDELNARVKGYIVAGEINTGRPTSYTRRSISAIRNPESYISRMRLVNPRYAESLLPSEMADPIQAYSETLRRLEDAADELREDRDHAYPGRLLEIAHFETVHGRKDALSELRAEVESDLRGVSQDIQDNGKSSQRVRTMLQVLSSPEGKRLLETFQKAGRDPRYLAKQREMQDSIKKLQALHGRAPFPKSQGTPGQIRWKEFIDMVERDRRENPSHWEGGDDKR